MKLLNRFTINYEVIVTIMHNKLTIIVGVMTSALSKDKDPTQEQDTV